jgi:hypothetical protein
LQAAARLQKSQAAARAPFILFRFLCLTFETKKNKNKKKIQEKKAASELV